MKWLVRLYPRKWRDQYEDEFVAMLEQHRVSVLDILNIIFTAGHTRLPAGQRQERHHARGAAVAGVLAIALCFSVGLVGISSLRCPTVQASPLIVTKAVIYHRVHRQWRESHTLHTGEVARFTLSFRRNGTMWVPVTADLSLQYRQQPKGRHPSNPVLYRANLHTVRRSRQAAFFSADLTVPARLAGEFYLQFNFHGAICAWQSGAVADNLTIR